MMNWDMMYWGMMNWWIDSSMNRWIDEWWMMNDDCSLHRVVVQCRFDEAVIVFFQSFPFWDSALFQTSVKWPSTRVARVFLVYEYQTGKMYQMNTKWTKYKLKMNTKWTQNEHKMNTKWTQYEHNMNTKWTKWTKNICMYIRPSKIDPNCDFWFENKPSGNPAVDMH
jgi:hypothetical protein